ncbi:putative GPI-anchored protein [Senna tora]|uniref:Putative GPI-anchored protein n=1 Tax=Senna tora TaxID=362788 RepID=A0A835CGE6_9FABA|nr:putative GPI-anchored protein [Senna tora]
MGNCCKTASSMEWAGDDWGSLTSKHKTTSSSNYKVVDDHHEEWYSWDGVVLEKKQFVAALLMGASSSSSTSGNTNNGKVKIKISKKELQELMDKKKKKSVEGVVSDAEQVLVGLFNARNHHHHTPWRPVLQSAHELHGSRLDHLQGSVQIDSHVDSMIPKISPLGAPQPLIPLLAPSPLSPFTNASVPKLSGICPLNFTAAENLMIVTAIDCLEGFATLMANVICCPQLEATLTILIGQSSKYTDVLALDGTLANDCFSDTKQILMAQGASSNLTRICSVHSLNLTERSCPVKDVDEFHDIVDTSKLLLACEKVDPVKECCNQICQNAILEAATRIASKGSDLLGLDGRHVLPEHSTRVNDCKSVVHRWLASELHPSNAKKVLRVLSNCNVNKDPVLSSASVCPLVLPDTRHVVKGCGDGIKNKTACCGAMRRYLSHLQKQRLITNLQALNCAETLAMKLQKSNITKDVFSLCHVSLKDFSLQEAGCLLQSLPSDATLEMTGISFLCDLNDNIPAPWPSQSQVASSSCNKTVNIPALPAAANGQSCLQSDYVLFPMLVAFSLLLMTVG